MVDDHSRSDAEKTDAASGSSNQSDDWHGRNPAIDDPADVVAYLKQYHPEPITASEIGETFNCDRRTALRRLQELAGVKTKDDQGLFDADPRVRTKQVGGRTRVFWFDDVTRGDTQ